VLYENYPICIEGRFVGLFQTSLLEECRFAEKTTGYRNAPLFAGVPCPVQTLIVIFLKMRVVLS
jgi:hypothetical protein